MLKSVAQNRAVIAATMSTLTDTYDPAGPEAEPPPPLHELRKLRDAVFTQDFLDLGTQT